MAIEAPERATDEAEWREVKESLSRAEYGERLWVQRLAMERRIKAFDSMKARIWRPNCVRRPSYDKRSSYIRIPRYDGPR